MLFINFVGVAQAIERDVALRSFVIRECSKAARNIETNRASWLTAHAETIQAFADDLRNPDGISVERVFREHVYNNPSFVDSAFTAQAIHRARVQFVNDL